MRRLFWVILALTIATFCGLSVSARSKKLQIIDNLDIKRYAGTWYEIDRLPNWFERNCGCNITATYSLNKDGTINVANQCDKKDGKAEIANGAGKFKDQKSRNGHLKVTFAPSWLRLVPLVWADYCILYLDDDYRFALIGEPGRKYLWILARERKIEHSQFDKMLKIARDQGFDLSPLIRLIEPI